MPFRVLCSNLKVGLKIAIKIVYRYHDTLFRFQFLRTLLVANYRVLIHEIPWFKHKYKVYHRIIAYLTKPKDCSQSSRKNFKNHQSLSFFISSSFYVTVPFFYLSTNEFVH